MIANRKFGGEGILNNTNKNKGFTLIELLAVIVILAIIALIATPIILNMINSANKSAAVDSTYGYIDAIEKNNALAYVNEKYSLIETGDVDSINDTLKIKGTLPISGQVIINKGRVIELEDFCINGYIVDYDGSKANVSSSCKNGIDFHGNLSAKLTDSKSQTLTNKTIVIFNDSLKYAKTSESGYFYINNISSGDYEIYILDKTISEVKKMSKDEIKQNSISNGTLVTKNKKITLENINVNNVKLSTGNKLLKNEVWNFDYVGSEDEFNILESGNYKLETWGAQGGSSGGIGGYGAYSVGTIKLNKNDNIYINVGGEGKAHPDQGTNESYWFVAQGGYNGGGAAAAACGQGGGGGATHIATTSGLLSTLSEKKDSILIVSSGGGGAMHWKYLNKDGTSGGGATTIANSYQIWTNGKFGQGGSGRGDRCGGGGGGSGFIGGDGGGGTSNGGGGSSYIANPNLTNKAMYCYKCDESNELSTKTISTENVSESPISNYAKKGNGYAKITYLGN